jgi:predicted RNase H-like HicB family nuclease
LEGPAIEVWRERSGVVCGGQGGHMRTFSVVVERDPDTELYVGHVPGWPGAHSQGATVDELRQNLREVLEMLLEDGEPKLETEFVGVQVIQVA